MCFERKENINLYKLCRISFEVIFESFGLEMQSEGWEWIRWIKYEEFKYDDFIIWIIYGKQIMPNTEQAKWKNLMQIVSKGGMIQICHFQ